MSRAIPHTLFAAVACTLLIAAAAAPAAAAGRRPSEVPSGDTVRVQRVIDGATIEVELGGALRTVRYLGVDIPSGNSCLAASAAAVNRSLVAGKLVRLERDDTDVDADGRLLRYVYVLDGRMAQEEMLTAGLARAIDGRPDVRYYDSFVSLESTAQAGRRGGWRACDWQPTLTAPIVDGCAVVEVERLMERRRELPELARVAPGDCVRIHKAANRAGPEWTGDYVYRPAGSTVIPGTMYLRWKDAFLLIKQEPDGAIFAHVVRDSYKARIFPWEAKDWDTTPGSTRVTMQTLIPDTADPSILVLPNPRTFLFKDLGNGQWQPLVDAFVYKSGDVRAPRTTPSGDVE